MPFQSNEIDQPPGVLFRVNDHVFVIEIENGNGFD